MQVNSLLKGRHIPIWRQGITSPWSLQIIHFQAKPCDQQDLQEILGHLPPVVVQMGASSVSFRDSSLIVLEQRHRLAYLGMKVSTHQIEDFQNRRIADGIEDLIA